ncbi:hypothetical protein AVEN_206336-1 [Araneus ventricosus]|uniref:Uncharacterized protein n=1 Tax=Araneus ventricosus TaxID=182803 RepID=A0A4Y2T8M1_ARAVE|nr:hypothetical protein AVEN_215194-1 [Araneus ventricosus]GBN96927.1 hypothetical protein AVEN_92670-1 [Araneus ventricosus]GBN96991.1 hypothetical protein AVEN_154652-1 [Araneus ventricosus]GBN96992.1 hypothetical protein AVEN_206336-1 [Araneus ventricosus]
MPRKFDLSSPKWVVKLKDRSELQRCEAEGWIFNRSGYPLLQLDCWAVKAATVCVCGSLRRIVHREYRRTGPAPTKAGPGAKLICGALNQIS